jgi:hypothetical protein
LLPVARGKRAHRPVSRNARQNRGSHGHFARDRETQKALGELSQDEIRFLAEIKKYSTTLSDGDKRLVLAMIRKMATLIPPPVAKKLIVRRPTV